MSEYILVNNEWKKATKVHLDGIPVGFSLPFRATQAPYGWLVEDGREISRTTYAKLFSVIGTMYGEGDGETTFNLPNSIGKYTKFGIGEEVGTELEAGLPNIEGTAIFGSSGYRVPLLNASGVLSGGERVSLSFQSPSSANLSGVQELKVNASLSDSIYGNSDTVTPPSLVALPCIKAFDTIADEVKINLAAELETLKARYEAERMISTIIYPNGGTKENPANVTSSQRYVLDNPFQGYFVQCEVQVKYNNLWGATGWIFSSSSATSFGVAAHQLNDGNIVVVSGTGGVLSLTNTIGSPHTVTANVTTALPCRVIVTRLGKISD